MFNFYIEILNEFAVKQDVKYKHEGYLLSEKDFQKIQTSANKINPEDGATLFDTGSELFDFTWNDIEAENQKRLAAYPMQLLRKQRDMLLAQSDWMVATDRTPTQAQLDYRQALRDLPATQGANAQIDETGKLIGVVFPTIQ